ncbi:MAG: helix-hairpin-helix domain-containing protein [Paludibacteraceae bacterium]|nr:helix-hairpin-helix domain-containing protein [Paludibacteraceae bacterium]
MKRFRFYMVIILLVVTQIKGKAQDALSTIEQTIADIFEQYQQEEEEELDFNNFLEDLLFVAENPIDLNRATREELEKLPFLSDIQIENILYYLYQFGPMQTIYELQLIDGLDMTDIGRMLPFVVVHPLKKENPKLYWHDLLNYGKNDLYIRLDRKLETKRGYLSISPEKNSDVSSKPYLGDPFYNSIKYRYHFRDKIYFGFTTEKDPGEPFLDKIQTNYDFLSGYLQLNNIGKFKTIILGDYRANFGQGLVLRQEFSMGKSSYVMNVIPRGSGLKKYSSTDEYNFFRGLGTTLQLGNTEISAFYSNKQIDGDTIQGCFSSIYKTGYHRTSNEFNKKKTVNQQVVGGNLTYYFPHLQIGATVVHTLFNHFLEKEETTYNHFYFSGNQQTTGGINYRFRWKKLNFFGETALSNHFSWATLNGCFFSPFSLLDIVVLYRNYSPDYETFYANAFSESTRINNEKGIYLGAELRSIKNWKFSAYADSYRFSWVKYRVDAPSFGNDYLLQVDFSPSRMVNMFWRLRYEEKQENLSQDTSIMSFVVPLKKASLRFQLNYVAGNFSFRTVLEGNLAQKSEEASWTYGLTAYQDLSYEFRSFPLRLDFRYQFFDATSYENRVYAYEKDVLYAFSIPMNHGLGSRYYLNLRYKFNHQLSCWLKFAQTVYADGRTTIGSGYELIQGNRKSDIRFLLHYKF